MVHFAVIIKVPDDNEGNYACAEALINPRGNQYVVGSKILVSPKFDVSLFSKALKKEEDENTMIDLNEEQFIFCNIPVFRLGEIMVMDSNDRTIPDGRKPSKWDVEYETFNDIHSAIKMAKKVVE